MSQLNAKSKVQYNTCRNKHHISYIVMDENTKFISHMCYKPQPVVWEKSYFVGVLIIDQRSECKQ
jgi:hypothetical protein